MMSIDAAPMIRDIYEPMNIDKLLRTSIPIVSGALNQNAYADYFWTAYDLHTIQAERKQNDELLASGLDKVEMLLRRQYSNADENLLIIEGFIAPSQSGECSILKMEGGKFYVQDVSEQSYSGLVAWLYQLDKAGITHYMTSDYRGTARLLAALFISAQKPGHVTLQRYIKPKIHLRVHNPQVRALMSIVAGIGEEKAKKLVGRYKTLWNIMNREVDELCQVEGIGPVLAKKILDGVGKPLS